MMLLVFSPTRQRKQNIAGNQFLTEQYDRMLRSYIPQNISFQLYVDVYNQLSSNLARIKNTKSLIAKMLHCERQVILNELMWIGNDEGTTAS